MPKTGEMTCAGGTFFSWTISERAKSCLRRWMAAVIRKDSERHFAESLVRESVKLLTASLLFVWSARLFN
jgi:hypothetical protein